VELELVGDVRLTVTGVVDVDLVQHVVAELEEVRAAGWVLQRHEVRDQRDGVGLVGTDERVDIGVVRGRVTGNSGCLFVR